MWEVVPFQAAAEVVAGIVEAVDSLDLRRTGHLLAHTGSVMH